MKAFGHIDFFPYLNIATVTIDRKTQTTKDLEKPWRQLPGDHSMFTTVLLDDSPAKVRLQPFNHICVKEYNHEMRLHDLRAQVLRVSTALFKLAERNHNDESHDEDVMEASSSDRNAPVTDVTVDESLESTMTREAWRKEKKERKKAAKAAEIMKDSPSIKYDETLLAVVGILDTMRVQTNVAAWIRAGGLWATKRPPLAQPLTETEEDGLVVTPPDPVVQRAPSPTDAEVGEADTRSVDEHVENIDERVVQTDDVTKPPSSLPLPSSSPQNSPPTSPGPGIHIVPLDPANTDLPSEDLPTSPTRKRLLSNSPSESIENGTDAKRPRNEPPRTEHIDTLKTGPSTVKVPTIQSAQDNLGVVSQLWFEDSEVFDYWVTHGREVLRELNIEEDPGINAD